jgi:hypothetical protein
MKSGTKGRGGFLATEYTEAVKPILKNTEKISVCSVWERSDLSVKFCGKKSRVGRDGFHFPPPKS